MSASLSERMKNLPFPDRLPAFHPSWRTSTAVQISSGIVAAKGEWGSLPILADALQDAGCDSEEILKHLREHEHVPGVFPNRCGGCWEGTCWVVQLVLQGYQRVVAKYAHDGTMRGDWNYAPVVNPGADNGKTWCVVPTTWANGPEYIVEAKSVTTAEDALIDDDDLGKDYRIKNEDLGDFQTSAGRGGDNPEPPEYDCSWTGSGHPYDTELIFIYGHDDQEFPFPCRYFGPGIPHKGVHPWRYANFGSCDVCQRERFPLLKCRPFKICSGSCIERVKEDRHIEENPEGGPP